MSLVHIARTATAVAVVFGATALAQATGQSSSQSQASQSSSGADQKVTVVGCVVRESDYRKMQDAGRGGVAGTGLGAGNEFVLTNASMSTGSTGASGVSSAGSSNAPGASSSSAGSSSSSQSASSSASSSGPGMAYELTGSGEGQAAQHVGRRVEVTGTLKAAEIGASGAPTGGPTAGRPPSGVDVASKDMKLREIDVQSIREVGSTCPAQ